MSEVKVALSQGGFGSGVKRKMMARGQPFKKSKAKRFPFSKSPAALRSHRPEIKTVDVNQVVHTLSTAGNVTLLNGLIEGVDANQRVGRRVNLKSIKIHMWWATSATPAAIVDTHCRYILVYDRQPNGAAPTWPDIMQNINVASATASDSMSNPNPTNFDRFLILRDGQRSYVPSTIALAPHQPAQDDSSFVKQTEQWYVKLNGLESTYIAGAGAGTIADFRTGSLYFFTLGSNAAANSVVTCTITARCRYSDT